MESLKLAILYKTFPKWFLYFGETFLRKKYMQIRSNENGFSLIEILIAILIMTVGILAMLSAISYSMVREQGSENRNTARQLTSSALESIFAARDLRNSNVLNNWTAINNDNAATPGIFLSGWRPIRQDAGRDGINGTADDACASGASCVVGGFTNSSPEIEGFDRRIVITDIVEPNIPNIRKRKIEISVRYFAGQLPLTETITTIIADIPFNR